MHKNGPYFVENGSIYSMYNSGFMLGEEPTILVDGDVGTLLKVGNKDTVTNYYNVIISKYTNIGCLDLANGIRLLNFNIQYEDERFGIQNFELTVDDICTIINWFSNSIGSEKMNWFLNLDLESVKNYIKTLQDIGF